MDPTTSRAFFRWDDLATDVVEGDVERVVYSASRIQLIEYRFPANRSMAVHEHATEEQIGYVISGHIALTIDGVEKVLGPGDFYHAAPGVPHGARTLDEPAVMLDVFGPPRADLMAISNVWKERERADG